MTIELPDLSADDVALTLTVIVKKDGKVVVTGPGNDLMLCYGLLELGKDSCLEYIKRMAQQKRIAVVAAGAIPKNGHQ